MVNTERVGFSWSCVSTVSRSCVAVYQAEEEHPACIGHVSGKGSTSYYLPTDCSSFSSEHQQICHSIVTCTEFDRKISRKFEAVIFLMLLVGSASGL